MRSEEFKAGSWIDRLARALRGLSETQGPFLRNHWGHNPPERVDAGHTGNGLAGHARQRLRG